MCGWWSPRIATWRKALNRETFREDLDHRVVVFPITLPPLRERSEDVPKLVEHFAGQICTQNGWKPVPFTAEAITALKKYPWPGNARELRNTVERLLLLSTSGSVDATTVQLALPRERLGNSASTSERCGRLSEQVNAFERAAILEELQRQRHHITNTANPNFSRHSRQLSQRVGIRAYRTVLKSAGAGILGSWRRRRRLRSAGVISERAWAANDVGRVSFSGFKLPSQQRKADQTVANSAFQG